MKRFKSRRIIEKIVSEGRASRCYGKVGSLMYYVYILLLANGQYYTGSTNDLDRRIAEHNSGKTVSIQYKLPVALVYQKAFRALKEVRFIERWIKKQKSKKLIEKIIAKEVDFSTILGGPVA